MEKSSDVDFCQKEGIYLPIWWREVLLGFTRLYVSYLESSETLLSS